MINIFEEIKYANNIQKRRIEMIRALPIQTPYVARVLSDAEKGLRKGRKLLADLKRKFRQSIENNR